MLNLQLWLTATAYFAILAGLYSFGLFVSIIGIASIAKEANGILAATDDHQRHEDHEERKSDPAVVCYSIRRSHTSDR